MRWTAGWLRAHAGVRLRSTLAAVAVVAVALAAGAGALTWLLQRSLVQSAGAAATQRAHEIAAQLDAGLDTGLGRALVAGPGEQSVAQVLRSDGTVVASSPELEGEPALVAARPRPGELVRTQERPLPVGDDGYVVAALGVSTTAGPHIVVVGQSLHAVEQSVQTLLTLLAVGLPLLLLVVGGATFWFVGRSLRPVEEIRSRVAGISGPDLSDRIPVPSAHDEVGRLAATMNDMLDRLESAQATQRRFIADASHELRSPLATLRSDLEVAATHPDSVVWAETTHVLLTETQRLERLVADLLLLARADERGHESPAEDVDLDDLADAERARVRRTTSLAVTGTVSPVRVRGDRHQLACVLRNLVDNAVRHARTTVAIEVRAYPDAGVPVVHMRVADDGPGIPADARQRIFERFVRLDEHRSRDSGGAGLGLAIARELVHAHGGTLRVDDAPGGGASFTVELPLPDAGAPGPGAAPGPARSRPGARRERAQPPSPASR